MKILPHAAFHSAWFASALVPFVPVLAIERVAQPTTNLNSAATQTKIDENRTRVNCVDGALNQSVMTCPQDCMIPTTNVSVTTVDVCDVSGANAWTCRWPTQWVTENEQCNNLGFGTGWTGTATVRREYEIQQCGQVVIPTGKPLQLIDVSQCARNRNETDTKPCPDRNNAYLANELGGAVGEQWRQATSKETGWQGAGVTLSRPIVEGLTPQGAVQVLSRGAYSIANVQCFRNAQRQVIVPCVNAAGVAVANPEQGCIMDLPQSTIQFSQNLVTLPNGYDRHWSYTRSTVYASTCTTTYPSYNTGVANVLQALGNDLIAFSVVSSESPKILQQQCSQETISRGWTTHDIASGTCGCLRTYSSGGDGGDGGGDGDGGGGDSGGDSGDGGGGGGG
ncbi:MAG: hypothetical protein INF43_03565, partial [Alphaproteobacteria bacterium]|nr:hypothetical protein [Alphaproteobacteria bacterium]